ncbi:MAG: response regulator [Bacteroidetes bacterium]|nr:response regulator [Bacteroidota bacterium]
MPAFTKVLFIDDDTITTKISERMMKLIHFAEDFVSSGDGQQAREYLMSNVDELPDIIFVDLHMTVMNGWEFLEWFQKWSAENNIEIPVYVLSSSLSKEDFDQAYIYNVNGYIVKPMKAEQLAEIMSKYPV